MAVYNAMEHEGNSYRLRCINAILFTTNTCSQPAADLAAFSSTQHAYLVTLCTHDHCTTAREGRHAAGLVAANTRCNAGASGHSHAGHHCCCHRAIRVVTAMWFERGLMHASLIRVVFWVIRVAHTTWYTTIITMPQIYSSTAPCPCPLLWPVLYTFATHVPSLPYVPTAFSALCRLAVWLLWSVGTPAFYHTHTCSLHLKFECAAAFIFQLCLDCTCILYHTLHRLWVGMR